jgi:uncharacterized protein (DUF1800 family)
MEERSHTGPSVVDEAIASILHCTDANASDTSDNTAATKERIAELELRLRERLEESTVLDREVRYLQSERQVLQDYIASIEAAAARLPQVEQARDQAEAELNKARRELEAFRARTSVVLINHLVLSVQRVPMARRIAGGTIRRLNQYGRN